LLDKGKPCPYVLLDARGWFSAVSHWKRLSIAWPLLPVRSGTAYSSRSSRFT